MILETPMLKLPRVCCREGCGRVARCFGGLVVFADQDIWPNTEGIGITMDLPLCTKHSESLTVDQILGKDGWDKLKHEMIRRGKVEPAEKHTRVRIFQWYEAHESIREKYL